MGKKKRKSEISLYFLISLLGLKDQQRAQTTALHMQIQRDHFFSPSSIFEMPLGQARKTPLCSTAVIF